MIGCREFVLGAAATSVLTQPRFGYADSLCSPRAFPSLTDAVEKYPQKNCEIKI